MSSITASQMPSSFVDAKRRERVFYTGMSILIAITVFAGFSRTWFLRPYFPQIQPLMPLLVLHGIIFSSWIALFITQTSLVAAKRTRTHMRLGIAVEAGVLDDHRWNVTAIVRAKGPPSPGSTAFIRSLWSYADLRNSGWRAFCYRRSWTFISTSCFWHHQIPLPRRGAPAGDFIQQYGPLAFESAISSSFHV
jgi:hypothetical protein